MSALTALARLPTYARITILLLFIWICYSLSSHPRIIIAPIVETPIIKDPFGFSHRFYVLATTRWRSSHDWRIYDYDPPWLDLAGFRQIDGFAWEEGLETWHSRCGKFGEVPRNIHYWCKKGLNGSRIFKEEDWGEVVGEWRGEWVRYMEFTDSRKEKTGLASGVAKEGSVVLRVEEQDKSTEMLVRASRDEEYELGYVHEVWLNPMRALVREVAATLTIQDQTVPVYGVHWPLQGLLIMTTTSEKFAGIFGLPHLSLTWEYFTASQRLLCKTVLESKKGKKAAEVREDKGIGGNCEYVVYMQMHPLASAFTDGERAVSEIDRKQKCVDGDAPEVQMSIVVFSPDCGFILESKVPAGFEPTDRQHLVCKGARRAVEC
jgi:hypothetical protein